MALRTRRNFDGLKHEVSQKFAEIRAALVMREKLLLRQIDVIENSQSLGRDSCSRILKDADTTTEAGKEIAFLAEQEEELLAIIRTLGRFQLDNMNLALQDMFLKNEDYITPSIDHETMYKCLKNTENVGADSVLDEDEQPEAIVVDFSKNKSLIEHNAKHMNKSIINITLQEAKELIRKAKIKRETSIPPLNLEELDDELESSIAEAVSSLGRDSPINTKSSQTCGGAEDKPKKNRFKPKITINNCNGTINLRNISSLTINCASEEHVNADIPVKHVEQQEPDSSNSLYCKGSKSSEKSTNEMVNDFAPIVASASVTIETSSTGNSTPTTTTSSSNISSNSSSRSHSKKQKGSLKKNFKGSKSVTTSDVTTTTKATPTTAATTQPTSTSAYPYEIIHDDDDDNVTCDFYNRLLNEIKNSLKEKSKRHVDIANNYVSSCSGTQANVVADSTTVTVDDNSNVSSSSSLPTEATSSTVQPGKRLILKNFENLKIILEANSDDDPYHPVQIEQWLAEIISETDLEPMQNTEILEHKHSSSSSHANNYQN